MSVQQALYHLSCLPNLTVYLCRFTVYSVDKQASSSLQKKGEGGGGREGEREKLGSAQSKSTTALAKEE